MENPVKTLWYRTPTTLISLCSLLITAIIGVITILNTRYIARLDKEVYIPNLQYSMYSDGYGSTYFETINQGYASAQNLTVTISWSTFIYLEDCHALPPYQDIMPVKPVVENNITYRLSSLPVQSVFKIVCTTLLSDDWRTFFQQIPPVQTVFFTPTPTGESDKVDLGLDLQGGLKVIFDMENTFYLPDGTMVDIKRVNQPQGLIEVNVVAENARPAFEIGQLSELWIIYGTTPP